MADWLLDGDPGMDLWEMDVRRFGAQYRSPSYTLARVIENYSTYYDIRYPARSGWRVGRCGPRPRTRGTAGTGPCSVRRAAGSGSTTTVERRVLGDDPRSAAAAGPGSCGRPRSRPSTGRPARRSGCSTSRRSPSSRCPGAGAAACSSGCATTGSRAASGRITYTQLLNARGGVECDFTVSQVEDERLPDRDRHGVRRARPVLDPPARPRDGSVLVRDVTVGVDLLRGLGAAGARGPRTADAAVPRHRGLPVT